MRILSAGKWQNWEGCHSYLTLEPLTAGEWAASGGCHLLWSSSTSVACCGPQWSRAFSRKGTLRLLHSNPAPRIPPKDITSCPLVLPRPDLVTQHLNIYPRTSETHRMFSPELLPGLTHDSPRPVDNSTALSPVSTLEHPNP